MPKVIAYYISGHGYGHATRSLEIVRALLAFESTRHIFVITKVAVGFIEEALGEFDPDRLSMVNRAIDSGAIQSDALTVDPLATLRESTRLYAQREELISRESAFLLSCKVDVVACDAPPLACPCAFSIGIPCIIISNFTWDYVYEEMLMNLRGAHPLEREQRSLKSGELNDIQRMVSACKRDISCATLVLQLPGSAPMLSPDVVVKRMPLVSRMSVCCEAITREKLGLPSGMHVLVLGFGGHSNDWSLALEGKETALPPGWMCLVLGACAKDVARVNGDDDHRGSRFLPIPKTAYIPNILECADVMIGKLGYGTVSEAINHRVPLIYVPRINWPEHTWLESLLVGRSCLSSSGDAPRMGLEMPYDDYASGAWGHYLERALAMKKDMPVRAMAKEAARVVAREVLQACDVTKGNQ